MARHNVSPMKSATIVVSNLLIDRVTEHVKSRRDDNKNSFFSRAILNQLEREGDFDIRDMLEEEKELYET